MILISNAPGAIGLLGAGGQAREIASFARREVQFQAVSSQYVVDGATVSIEAPTAAQAATPVVAAVGPPGVRRKLVDGWPGTLFATVIAETAFVAEDAQLGEGCVIAPLTAVMANALLGKHVIVNANAVVSHDCVLGDFVTVSPGAHIGGGCVIEAGAFIGIGATVSNGIRIASGAVIGSGAVVIDDVAELEVVVGVPARHLRTAEEWLVRL